MLNYCTVGTLKPILLVGISLTLALVSSESTIHDPNAKTDYHCKYYLAPSSIQGAGFGIYTVEDIKDGDPLLPYAEPSINNCGMGYYGDSYTGEGVSNFPSYVWGPVAVSGSECTDSELSVCTFGSLCNYHTYLMNVKPVEAKYDDTVADRFQDPGAGAFSYHGGQSFHATRDITAGEEIFADYGENWLDTREDNTDYAKFVPRWDDFVKAGQILHKIITEFGPVTNDSVFKVIKSIVQDTFNQNRISGLIPQSFEEFKKLMELVGDDFDPNKVMDAEEYSTILAKETIQQRSVEWIQENGLCLDTLRSDISTIPGAGRGAFAQTFFSKGSLILPSPLIAISDKNLMNIYQSVELETEVDNEEKDVDEEEHVYTRVVGKQLIINYSFGHKDSPLLLHPQTNALLLNHCSERNPQGGRCGELGGPNAKIQWGTSWDPDTPQWLNLSHAEIVDKINASSRGLSFDIIALRDIDPGEEVFIDYGVNWENAWNDHLNNWEPPNEDETSYVPLRKLLEANELRNVEELKSNPYPENVRQMCCFWESEWSDVSEEDIIGHEFDGFEYLALEGPEKAPVEPCEVIEKASDGAYWIRLFRQDEKVDKAPITFYNYPKECITFRLKEDTADTYQAGVFRHYIEIDDSIFPDNWKMPLSTNDDDNDTQVDGEESLTDENDEL